MKASILTFSQTGNTWKTGQAIMRGLLKEGIKARQVSFLQRSEWHPEKDDVVLVGCPVFVNRPATVVLDYLKSNGFDFKGKKAFVFITSGGSPARSRWHLAQALSATGAEVCGGIQVRGVCTYPTLFNIFPGRPNLEDIGEAEKFGKAAAAHVNRGEPMPTEFHIDPDRGGGFYDVWGPIGIYSIKMMIPIPKCDSARCNGCGICVKECPTGNIAMHGETPSFNNECIRCFRCWHICPKLAISMKTTPGKGILDRIMYSEWMERHFGDIKTGEHQGKNLYVDVLSRKIRLKYDPKELTAEFIAKK